MPSSSGEYRIMKNVYIFISGKPVELQTQDNNYLVGDNSSSMK
jgi:hypothetical protein